MGDELEEDRCQRLIWNIAVILDHPSVYMGGPSLQSRQKAGRIVEYIKPDLAEK